MILNRKTYKKLDRNNQYFSFIESCRKKQYSEGTTLHMHHIIPQYVFGKNPSIKDLAFRDSIHNVLSLSLADHIIAHDLLYQIYGNPQDRGAILFLNNYKDESRSIWHVLGACATNNLMRERGLNFWDNNYQREMARRSMNRPDAIQIRKKAGQLGGVRTKTGVAIKKNHKYVFFRENEPVLCIINCDLGSQVLIELNKFHKTPLQRTSQLLNRTKKTLHGWSCIQLNDDGSEKK